MTIPGNMLRDNVSRLADVIRASKETSEDIKKRVAAQQNPPVAIGEESRNASPDTGSQAA